MPTDARWERFLAIERALERKYGPLPQGDPCRASADRARKEGLLDNAPGWEARVRAREEALLAEYGDDVAALAGVA